jgi:hypothetical protein
LTTPPAIALNVPWNRIEAWRGDVKSHLRTPSVSASRVARGVTSGIRIVTVPENSGLDAEGNVDLKGNVPDAVRGRTEDGGSFPYVECPPNLPDQKVGCATAGHPASSTETAQKTGPLQQLNSNLAPLSGKHAKVRRKSQSRKHQINIKFLLCRGLAPISLGRSAC